MANKKLIEVSLQKSYKGELNSELNSILFQDICETALEVITENEELKKRLEISPQGDDRIDGLEEALEHCKFKLESKTKQNEELKLMLEIILKSHEKGYSKLTLPIVNKVKGLLK